MNKSNAISRPPWKAADQTPSADLAALAESLPALVFLADADGQVVQANWRLQEHTGQREVAGTTWLSWVHPHDRTRALAEWRAAGAEGLAVEIRLRLCQADGHGEWFNCRGVPVHADGRIERWAFSAVAAPAAAPVMPPDHGNAWYWQAFEHAAVGLARVDADGRIVAANPCLCRMLGCSRSQLLGSDIRHLVAQGDGVSESGVVTQPHGAVAVSEGQQRWLRADGSCLDVKATVTRVPGETDEAGHLLWIIEDVSQHEARARDLAAHDATLECFVDAAPAAIALFDRDMRYLAHSRQYLAELGLPSTASLRGRSHYEVLPEIPRHWRGVHARVLQGQEHVSENEPFHRPDGSTDRVRWSMRPWGRRSGAIDGAVLFFEVVTARVLAERAQQASLRRLRESETRQRQRSGTACALSARASTCSVGPGCARPLAAGQPRSVDLADADTPAVTQAGRGRLAPGGTDRKGRAARAAGRHYRALASRAVRSRPRDCAAFVRDPDADVPRCERPACRAGLRARHRGSRHHRSRSAGGPSAAQPRH